MSEPSTTDKTKPVFKTPNNVGGHRLNDLFKRYRQIVIELKGLTLTELSDKPQRRELEDEILHDFVKLERKYLNREE